MPYQDTVFGGLMKAFPRWRFDKLVERHGADYRVRRLPSWTQFQAMVFCRVLSKHSIHDVFTMSYLKAMLVGLQSASRFDQTRDPACP